MRTDHRPQDTLSLKWDNTRITSYNVCYTKLLRDDKLSKLNIIQNFKKGLLEEIGSKQQILTRITSYNVCYTKLLRLIKEKWIIQIP